MLGMVNFTDIFFYIKMQNFNLSKLIKKQHKQVSHIKYLETHKTWMRNGFIEALNHVSKGIFYAVKRCGFAFS